MLKELKVIIDIYSTPDKEGNSKLLKKNVVKKKIFKIIEIETLEELINEKGKPLKTMCLVQYKGQQCILKHKYHDIFKIMNKEDNTSPVKSIGFKYKNKK